MKHLHSWTSMAALLAALISQPAAAQTAPAANDSRASGVQILGGKASFDVATNVPGVAVHGKSQDLRGRAAVRKTGDTLAIEEMSATVSVASLSTGIGLRDRHMRQEIFTTQAGDTPDLTFVADKAVCSREGGAESVCNLSGQLTIRNLTRPFTLALKVTESGAAYRAAGEGLVKLSTYGIAAPSRLGVSTRDEVKLHIEFTAKPAAATSVTHSGGAR